MNFQIKHFDELTNLELYEILKLRFQVFVIEQNCIYNELDGIDTHCSHVFLFENNNCIATSRILPPNIKHQNYASIGRVCCALHARNKNAGKKLMEYSIAKAKELFPNISIKIGAQLYLKKFYESFGFIQTSQPYDEDGIMHIDMLIQTNKE